MSTLENAHGWIVLLVAFLLILLVMKMWKTRSKSIGNESSAKKSETIKAEDSHDHDHKPAAKGGGHDDHGHHSEKKDGWGLLRFSIGLLAFVVAVGVGYLAYRYVGLDSIPQTRGQAQRGLMSSAQSASLYQAPVIPPTACSVTPSDAREVVAPVDGCSEVIQVDTGTYPCTDPGTLSGHIRAKSWYGQTEPTGWDNSVSGDQMCLGATPRTDDPGKAEPVTVHVWLEHFQ